MQIIIHSFVTQIVKTNSMTLSVRVTVRIPTISHSRKPRANYVNRIEEKTLYDTNSLPYEEGQRIKSFLLVLFFMVDRLK